MNKVDFARNVARVALLRHYRKSVTLTHAMCGNATGDSCDCSHFYFIYLLLLAKSHDFDAKYLAHAISASGKAVNRGRA